MITEYWKVLKKLKIFQKYSKRKFKDPWVEKKFKKPTVTVYTRIIIRFWWILSEFKFLPTFRTHIDKFWEPLDITRIFTESFRYT